MSVYNIKIFPAFSNNAIIDDYFSSKIKVIRFLDEFLDSLDFIGYKTEILDNTFSIKSLADDMEHFVAFIKKIEVK